jgi:hypothetical protein
MGEDQGFVKTPVPCWIGSLCCVGCSMGVRRCWDERLEEGKSCCDEKTRSGCG